MNKNEMNYVQNHIDYRFKNLNLLAQAFTIASYASENGEETCNICDVEKGVGNEVVCVSDRGSKEKG